MLNLYRSERRDAAAAQLPCVATPSPSTTHRRKCDRSRGKGAMSSKMNPASSASSLEPTVGKKRRKLSARATARLPTPPPDPNEKPKEPPKAAPPNFLDYLSTPVEDAFDHLDKLYKLMEQVITLREQNVMLHRKIVDLELLRNIQDMHQQLESSPIEDLPAPEYDHDTAFAENFLCNILTGTKKDSSSNKRFRQSILRRPNLERRISAPAPSSASSSPRVPRNLQPSRPQSNKVSKWTKVKAAFKWEKASPTVSDAKSQDSGLGGMLPVNYEVARYLRVPSTSEDLGTSPGDSGAAEASTPATMSSNSSVEDLHNHHRRVPRRTQEDTSDDEQLFTFDYIPTNKDEPSTSPNKSTKSHHRTTWAKMKGIIQTQTSLKKKHRLSAKSDDFKIDGSICSDNEEVFESEKSPVLIIQSPEEINKENQVLSMEHNIPVDVIARYRVLNDDNLHESKWSKVKKAFLSSPSISRNEVNEFPSIKRDAHPTKESDERLRAEIQRNYLQLQKKLTQEFQEKLQEWERSKLTTPTSLTSNSPNPQEESPKDLAFKKKMEEWERIKGHSQHKQQLQSEENLPPEFRKKLQEWKKIKKSSLKEDNSKKNWSRWRSVSANRSDSTVENLSEDFIKKYESWKQIKTDSFKSPKTPSPRLSRKDSSSTKKIKDETDKELQWIEKELGKIEREKQRLERDRQKFIDREERLAKLRRSVTGSSNKKEILVHTPSGFYRFEGISRKFTRKLYEWEKAQGIAPEASTFALLKSSCIPNIGQENKPNLSTGSLVRSKSADSIMNPENGPVCNLMNQQPSSLSLNDMANLEKDMMLNSPSVPDIVMSSEQIDSEEPEAIIVEVEDVVEETASLLENFMEKYIPVYQKQENSNMCEGETRAAPTIRRSESARAQANYNLIEDVIGTLRKLSENENDIEALEITNASREQLMTTTREDDDEFRMLKVKQMLQKELSGQLLEKLSLLQTANANVTSDITKAGTQYTHSRVSDVLETIQDLSSEIYNLAESIDRNVNKRNKSQKESSYIFLTRHMYPQISDNLNMMINKILELRRNLSYICAASDMSVSSWKKKYEKAPHHSPLRKMPSIERKRANFRKSRSRDSQDKDKDKEDSYQERRYEKNSPRAELSRQIEQGAIKKRLRYRQKGMVTKTLDETDDDEDFVVAERKPKPRRIRSQNSTESNKSDSNKTQKHREVYDDSYKESSDDQNASKEVERKSSVVIDPGVVEKVVVPTKTTNFLVNFSEKKVEADVQEEKDTAVTVFVKTTRKLFTPIASASGSLDFSVDESVCSVTSAQEQICSESEGPQENIIDKGDVSVEFILREKDLTQTIESEQIKINEVEVKSLGDAVVKGSPRVRRLNTANNLEIAKSISDDFQVLTSQDTGKVKQSEESKLERKSQLQENAKMIVRKLSSKSEGKNSSKPDDKSVERKLSSKSEGKATKTTLKSSLKSGEKKATTKQEENKSSKPEDKSLKSQGLTIIKKQIKLVALQRGKRVEEKRSQSEDRKGIQRKLETTTIERARKVNVIEATGLEEVPTLESIQCISADNKKMQSVLDGKLGDVKKCEATVTDGARNLKAAKKVSDGEKKFQCIESKKIDTNKLVRKNSVPKTRSKSLLGRLTSQEVDRRKSNDDKKLPIIDKRDLSAEDRRKLSMEENRKQLSERRKLSGESTIEGTNTKDATEKNDISEVGMASKKDNERTREDHLEKDIDVSSEKAIDHKLEISRIIVDKQMIEMESKSKVQFEETTIQTPNCRKNIPPSPVPQRKLHKEISPNIRLMMVKYNQKISEETGQRSTGSSGSASPVAWRSPVFERRVKAQTERYQKELQKMSPLLGGKRDIQKSASMGVVVTGNKQLTIHSGSQETVKGILKSSSAGVINTTKKMGVDVEKFGTIIEDEGTKIVSTRSSKIQKAKEEFLNLNIRKPDEIKYTTKNRLSQISVESSSSCTSSASGLLVKSASAGMINVDPDTYRQLTELHSDGYVSLPRSKSRSIFSNITSKFRKVKMRKHRETKMSAVSTLCRQSLVVDINDDSRPSSSTETSPSTSRSGSWIKRPKLFSRSSKQ